MNKDETKHPKTILVSWIGRTDLDSLHSEDLGPIRMTLAERHFEEIHLLCNYPHSSAEPYIDMLLNEGAQHLHYHNIELSSPTDYGEIYLSSEKILAEVTEQQNASLNILLSPGTPAMQAVWVLLGKTTFPAIFIQSSVEQGVQDVDIPFDISAEFKPKTLLDDANVINSNAPIDSAFEDIMTVCPVMLELKQRATVLAKHDIPVLIQGETGTGKELFATAIHNASSRQSAPFIALNCGAIPSELIDSTLFGHKKGAFTGAYKDALGAFQKADGGTLFLDEFGELPKQAQVRLLRVLQSGEVTPVGGDQSVYVNVRVIAATNRDLMKEVIEDRFREDLFYRVAVGTLNLPSLNARKGDVALLAEKLLEDINRRFADSDNKKKISLNGKNVLISHVWQGNIRELHATLIRAFIWSGSNEISDKDIQSVLISMPDDRQAILGKELSESFNIHDVMATVAHHYIERALDESNQNLTQAAQKLGLASYQTLKSWIEKYQVN